MNIPTEFRVLNDGRPVTLGANDDSQDIGGMKTDLLSTKSLQDLLNKSPSGLTPLCYHIGEVVKDIEKLEQQLRDSGDSVSVIIATDGVPTDGSILDALKPLAVSRTKVNIVVRLYTDAPQIFEYWNKVDKDLELPIDVMDDIEGEFKEIRSFNPCLEYLAPLHQFRESGVRIADLDLIDERKLSANQIKKICTLM